MEKQSDTLRRDATSSGARWGIGAAICVLVVLGSVFLYARQDPDRMTVTPTVERAPNPSGIGPGRPVTPEEAAQRRGG